MDKEYCLGKNHVRLAFSGAGRLKRVLVVNKDGAVTEATHPKCSKCGQVFGTLVCLGDGMVVNMELTTEKELMFVEHVVCRCGHVTKFIR